MDKNLINMMDAEKAREDKSLENMIDLVLQDTEIGSAITSLQEEITELEDEFNSSDKAGVSDDDLRSISKKIAMARERLAELSIDKKHSEQRVRAATEQSKHISGRISEMRDLALKNKP